MAPRGCLLADAQTLVLRGLAELCAEWGFEVQAAVADAAEAVRRAGDLRPELAVVDPRLHGLDGRDVVRELVAASSRTAVIAYTGRGDRATLDGALAAGARGFVLKEAPVEDLRRAVLVVAQGGVYVDPVAGARLLEGRQGTALTEREREVLGRLAAGLSYKEIAADLAVSLATVRSVCRSAVRRLGARTRIQAVATAVRTGLIA